MPGRKKKSRSKRRKSKAQSDVATGGSESSSATSSRPTSAQSATSSVDDSSISVRSKRKLSKAQNDAATGGSESSSATSSRPTSAHSATSSMDDGSISTDVAADSNARKTKEATKGSKLDLDDIDLSSSVDAIKLNDNQQKAKKNGNGSTGGAIGGKATGEDNGGACALADKKKDYDVDDDEDRDDVVYYYDTDDSSGWEDEKDDDEDEDEGVNRRREIRECLTCGNTSRDMNVKKCGGCGQATYCGKKCQREGWKEGHKQLCAKYRRFSSQLSGVELRKLELRHGPLEKRVSSDYFIGSDQGSYEPNLLYGIGGPKQCVILEVVCRHPHIVRPGCIVRDADGKQIQVIFHSDPNTFLHVGVLAPTKVDLRDVMKPGIFFCLVDPAWHYFVDGTVGIRIDEHEEFELLSTGC